MPDEHVVCPARRVLRRSTVERALSGRVVDVGRERRDVTQVPEHDIVLVGGRVVDPETEADGIANVGITSGRITAVSGGNLTGRLVLDVGGHVVRPGFIDLHSHAEGIAEQRLQVLDGVTARWNC